MDEVRQKVINRLATLKEVEFDKPTSRELRGPRHLMGRVQRQENRLYKQRVLKQQKALKLKLAKIDKYRADLRAEKERRLGLWDTYRKNVELESSTLEGSTSSYFAPVFKPLYLAVPRPSVHVSRAPRRRIQRAKRRIRRRLR